jgi:holo-[acyl-carrier protein] synthase
VIAGTGIDIVNIERVQKLTNRWGERFIRRVFTEAEICCCRRRARAAECFASRFAAKEAFLKAVGWGLQNGISWTDIEVGHDGLGKPVLVLRRKAEEVLESRGIRRVFVSLSHDDPWAVAQVILESDP